MEKYWRTRPSKASPTPSQSPSDVRLEAASQTLESEFDRLRRTMIAESQEEEEGWEPELRRYLKDLPEDVTRDTDIVEWWGVR